MDINYYINNFEKIWSIKKVTDASKEYYFLSTFAYRKDSVANKLEKLIRGKEKENFQGKRVNSIFNILWHLGYFPQMKYMFYLSKEEGGVRI